jgi:hypothetical protein
LRGLDAFVVMVSELKSQQAQQQQNRECSRPWRRFFQARCEAMNARENAVNTNDQAKPSVPCETSVPSSTVPEPIQAEPVRQEPVVQAEPVIEAAPIQAVAEPAPVAQPVEVTPKRML